MAYVANYKRRYSYFTYLTIKTQKEQSLKPDTKLLLYHIMTRSRDNIYIKLKILPTTAQYNRLTNRSRDPVITGSS